MPRPKTRTAELRDHVLRVALTTLAREGVAGFTTRRVAADASTSTPAVYELFGDKAGLIRAVFFEGYRLLGRYLGRLTPSDDPIEDVVAATQLYRQFVAENRELARVMFSRPFADFAPGPDDAEAGAGVELLIVGLVQRAVDSGALVGDATDLAQGLLALSLGLADAEGSSRLGRRPAAIDRRWDQSIRALLRGYGPDRTPS